MKPRSNPFLRSVAFTAMSVGLCSVLDSSFAANIWDGGGGASTNWTTGANWDDNNTATSGSGNDVTFGAGTTSLNDYLGYTAWRSVIFNSGLSAFTLNSSAGANWDLYFKVENNSANAAIVNIDNVSLKGSGNEFDPTVGNLTINTQNIHTNGNNLNVFGTKILTITNSGGSGITGTGGLTLNSLFTGTTILSGSNNFTGATQINGGKLQINSGGSLAAGSAVGVNATGAGALTINSGGTVGGNVTVAPSVSATTANLVNNGTISGNLTINSSSVPAPIAVQANPVISGNTTLNGGSSTSSGGNIKVDGQLTIAGSTAVTLGSLTSTGTGNGVSAGTGAINYINTTATGNTLSFADGSSFAWLALGNGAVGCLNTAGTVSLYSYSQNSGTGSAVPYSINITGGTWNVGQVGQNNTGKIATGTTNILGGSIFNLGATSTWAGLGASNGGGFMHGIWNIGGTSAGSLNITGGFSEQGGFASSVPTSGAINGLQITVGNGGALTTTTSSTLGFGNTSTAQIAGQSAAQVTNSLTINPGGSAVLAGNFTVANSGVAQTNIATTNSLTVSGGGFSNSGGILYIGNNSLANSFLESNSVTVAGGTLNQAGGAVSLGASNTTATNYANSLTISSGAMNIGISASVQALQLGTASNTAASVSNTVNLQGGKLLVSGEIKAMTGTGQVNTFNWTGGQLTAGTVTATSSTWTAASGGGIASSILNNTGGTFAPGDIGMGGKTTIAGGYTQGAGGILAIDLGSATIATAFQSGVGFYDTIAMTGPLVLDGKLSVSAINSYTPSGSFNIIAGATSNSGNFTNVNATTSRVNLTTGGSMVFTRGATSTLTAYSNAADLIWAGDGTANVWDTATSNWTKGGVAGTYSDASADYVTFDDTGPKSPAVTLNSTVSPTGVYFSNTSGTYTVAGSGTISGAATLNVQGPGGTVVLNTANDFTGATTITAGTLQLGNATALGATAAGTAVSAGAVLDVNGQTIGAEAMTINGTGISGGGALINSNTGAPASLNGLVTFSNDTSIGGSGDITLSSGIAATAATNKLIKTGNGTVTLSAAASTNRSTVNATTQIDDGVLRIQNASALATGTTAVTTISSGGVLELSGGITLDQPITFKDGGTLRSDGANASQGKITVSNAADVSVTLSTVASSDVFTVGNGSNDVTGGSAASTINISGPGTVKLAAASDYAGKWTLASGTLQLGSETALGAGGALTITGGSLDVTAARSTTNNNPQNWNGDFIFLGTNTYNTGTGAVTLGGDRMVTVNASSMTVGGIIDDGISTYGLTKAGAGTLTLTGANTYGGDTSINAGTLTLNPGASTSVGSIQFNGTSTLILAGSAALNLGSIRGSGFAGTINDTNTNAAAKTLTFANGSSFAAITAGAGALLKLQNGGGTTFFTNFLQSDAAFAATLDGGTWNVVSMGTNSGSARFGGTLNIINGAVLNTASARFAAHGTTNIGGSGTGTMNITNTSNSWSSESSATNPFTYNINNGGTLASNTEFIISLRQAALGAARANSINISAGGIFNQWNHLTIGGTVVPTSGSESNTLALSGGKLLVSGTLSQAAALTGVTNAFDWTGGQLSAGTITATNMPGGALTNNSGILAAGDTGVAGRTAITGSYTQGASGVLAIDLGGATAATAFQNGASGNFDLVTVSGTADLNGSARINILPGYRPSGTFNVLISTGTLTASGGSFQTNVQTVSTNEGFSTMTVTTDTTNKWVQLGGYTITNQWAGTGSDWSDAAGAGSWTSLDPDANSAGALFANTPGTVNLVNDRTVRNVTFAPATSAFTIAAGGGALTLDGGSSGAAILSNAIGNNTINAPVSIGANGVNAGAAAGTTLTLGGALSGSGAFNVYGPGTVALSADNSLYTGAVTVQDGVNSATNPQLLLSHNNALGAASSVTVYGTPSSGSSVGSRLMIGNGITVTGKTVTLNPLGQRAALQVATGTTGIWNGNVQVNGSGSAYLWTDGTMTVGASSSNVVNSAITLILRGAGTGTLNSLLNLGSNGFTKTDAGTWTINSNANPFTGATSIGSGTIIASTIANSGAVSALGAGTTINLGQNAAGAGGVGTFRFTGATGGSSNRTINIANGANGGGGIIENTISGQTLTLTGNVTTGAPASASILTLQGAGDGLFSGNVTGSPNLALSKSGTGTWTLSGTNTYTGATTVTAGSLAINGDQSAATGNVTISNAGSVLEGGGTIGGATSIQAGAMHAAGNGVGIQKFTNSLTYEDASIFAWEIDRSQTQTRGIGYDAVNVTGALAGLDGVDAGTTTDAVFRIVIGDSDFSDPFWASSNHSWTDIFAAVDGSTVKNNWADIFGGDFEYYNGNTAISAPSTGSFSISGNTLSWTFTAVPEPTSALAGLLIAAGLLRRRREGKL